MEKYINEFGKPVWKGVSLGDSGWEIEVEEELCK